MAKDISGHNTLNTIFDLNVTRLQISYWLIFSHNNNSILLIVTSLSRIEPAQHFTSLLLCFHRAKLKVRAAQRAQRLLPLHPPHHPHSTFNFYQDDARVFRPNSEGN